MLDPWVEQAVQDKIAAGEPFTTACISHPLIKNDASIRHFDVSEVVKDMWRNRQMVDSNGMRYLRTLITVWPDGPGTIPAQAFLYYPDNGYDPSQFNKTTRVLIRNPSDGDDDNSTTITNTSDGSAVRKQCQIQQKERTLNVPRFLIKSIGWQPGLHVDVISANNQLRIELSPTGKQKIDKEGRIRLHGAILDDLGTANPTAMLVEPDMGEKYLLIAQVNQLPAVPFVPTNDNTTSVPSCPVAGSVWG